MGGWGIQAAFHITINTGFHRLTQCSWEGAPKHGHTERGELGILAWVRPSCFPGSRSEVVKLLEMLSELGGSAPSSTPTFGAGQVGARHVLGFNGTIPSSSCFVKFGAHGTSKEVFWCCGTPWTSTERWASLVRVQPQILEEFPPSSPLSFQNPGFHQITPLMRGCTSIFVLAHSTVSKLR